MIPKKLILKGIYSYQTRQEIDFTNLTNGHLFGIFGPIGSGKSTILEAITLALYGETERLNQKDNRPYNMMNLKSNELSVDFEFRAGKENTQLYAFTVTGKRDKASFESVKSFQRAGYRIEAGQRIPLDVKTAEEIIGLSYENFRRTIIIPQGKFQEFLQLTEADRTRMLKEIFNLHKYDLQSRTALIENANNEQLSRLEGQLAEIGSVTKDQIDQAEEALVRAVSEQGRIDEELKTKQAEEKGLQSLAQLFDKLEMQKSVVAGLAKQKPAFERREKTLREYELCVQQFKDILDQESTQRESIDTMQDSLERKRKLLKNTDTELTRKNALFKRVKEHYECREELKEESEDLATVLKVRETVESINGLLRSVNEKESLVTDLAGKVAKLNDDLKAAKALLAGKKKQLPDQKKLSDIQKWFTNKNNLIEQLDRANGSIKLTESELKKLNETKVLLLETKGLQSVISRKYFSLSFDKLTEKLAEAKKSLKSDLKKCQDEIEHKEVQKQLGLYAEALKPGAPCPVCGATDHPKVILLANVEKELKALLKTKSDLDNSIDTIEAAIRELAKIGGKHAKATELMKTETIALERAQKRLDQHLEAFQWKAFDEKNEGKVDSEFNRAEKLDGAIQRLEGSITKQQEQIEGVQAELDEARSSLEKEKRELAGLKGECTTRLQQLRRKTFEEYARLSNPQAKMRIAELDNEQREIEKAYKQLEQEIEALSKSVNTLQGQIKEGEKNLASAEKSYNRTFADIDKRIASTAMGSVSNVQKVLTSGVDPKREQKQIEEFKHSGHSGNEKLRELLLEAEGKSYNHKLHTILLEKIDSLRKRTGLEKDHTRLSNRAQDIEVMKSLFRASGFVNYVSTVYLRNVCCAANVRFSKLTRQKLRLELSTDNTFHVRDFMNDGKVRIAKTLSGGQLFQASLSLALALGDQIQQMANADQTFFFLDEGFGSLDKESLQAVFETLASLRKENRIVGIISHVDELQQEITTHLKVKNIEEQGTTIEPSWV